MIKENFNKMFEVNGVQLTSQLSLLDTAKEGKIGKRQQQILDVFNNYDSLETSVQEVVYYNGFCINNRQIAQTLKLPINSITPRVNELRKIGKLVEYKKMRDNITNRLVTYWRLAYRH